MNDKKLHQLFAASRGDTFPAPPADFAAGVLRAVQQDPARPAPAPASVWDNLSAWCPRLGLAAAALIILCLAADWASTAAGLPDLGDGAAPATSQYLFNAEDL